MKWGRATPQKLWPKANAQLVAPQNQRENSGPAEPA
jgi:hypothetical protein